ncbi:HAMP domain-containing sensor histidine kinase [Mycobacterium sp. CVI_P3]|uniref:histidine kinase n=1 Tax=Mycobacterium pinniadriaticum TaxID=2994102 RepID=A0ABT3SDI5_9MYCO|nr:HAMP domain-containing sensor histidine kinase [Mycobacterium pinniadriaticum]MCX2931028.1 HAMP domain-containing sensor histidine kinase [Mycobacterium pinniadriaticum]MCX2937452.1 HAMP domain-containing sensor histidine kinase [Mycobacterium pinniadriaticum]
MSQNLTPTPSLRRRVTLAVVGLIAMLLVIVGIVFDLVFGARLTDDLDDEMVDLFYDAPALVEGGLSSRDLVNVLKSPEFRVQVVGADGTVYGDPQVVPAERHAHPLPKPVPADIRPSTPLPWGDLPSLKISGDLPDGSLLTMQADTSGITRTRNAMRWYMLFGSLGTLAVATLAVRWVAGRALSPLQRLIATADGITRGARGRRIHPDRRSTELGKAAEAFDRMLDAMESAELAAKDAAAVARRAEAQSKQFLSDAAHELRTPLAGIQVIADQLMASTGTRPDEPSGAGVPGTRTRRHAELLCSETRRAARLLNDLLDIARIDAGVSLRPERTDLGRIVDDEVDRAAMLAPGLSVRRTGERQLYVDADPNRLAQILSNLLDNARRHTPPSGHITVNVERADGTAQVTVSDTGPGVPDDDRERIFDRLVRLDDARDRDSGGAGLGLAIARGLAEAHGAALVCLPNDGGAVFRLSLPLSQALRPEPAQQ